MVNCVNCGKEIPEDQDLYCDNWEAPLCEENAIDLSNYTCVVWNWQRK